MEHTQDHVQCLTFRHSNADWKIICLVIKQRRLGNKQRHNISITCCKERQGYLLRTSTVLFISASLETQERAASIYRENIWLRVTSFRFAFLCFAMIMWCHFGVFLTKEMPAKKCPNCWK